jgi:hypothetical protein
VPWTRETPTVYPEDIAHACSFLVSDGAGYVTGQVIGVNVGNT